MAGSNFEEIKRRFEPVLERFLDSSATSRLAAGELTVDHYRSWMKQVYYYVRENPQIQTLGTVFFRGRQRFMVRNVFKHAISEVGHEQLALNDFVTLGGDAATVPYKNPLPATAALNAYAYYQIYNLNPMGYLGYLFFLEFLPTQIGDKLTGWMTNSGVPENALTWMREHIELDNAHNRMMERYVDELLKTEADFAAVEYAMHATGDLYALMIASAIEDAERPFDTGWNWEELNADGLTPAHFADAKKTEQVA